MCAVYVKVAEPCTLQIVYLCVCVCVRAGLWITCQSPGATMLKMDRNFAILVFPSAAMSQRWDKPKMPAWSMWVVAIGTKVKPSLTGFYTITRDYFSSVRVLPTVQRHVCGGWANLILPVDPVVSWHLKQEVPRASPKRSQGTFKFIKRTKKCLWTGLITGRWRNKCFQPGFKEVCCFSVQHKS